MRFNNKYINGQERARGRLKGVAGAGDRWSYAKWVFKYQKKAVALEVRKSNEIVPTVS